MGLDRYKPARIRFKWRNRRVPNTEPQTGQKVLEESKNQRKHGGQCTYFAACCALKAHQRLKTNLPCEDLKWIDLKEKVDARKDDESLKGLGGVTRCLTVLKDQGVHYKNSQESLKIKKFDKFDLRKLTDVAHAVKRLKEGLMLGTFEVYGAEFDTYGLSPEEDSTYFVNPSIKVHMWTHCVVITGIRVQGHPFREFQNSYGPKWRGAARGFGQIYALDFLFLYSFMLAENL